MYREFLCTLHLVFLNGDILCNYSAVSQPGNRHWFKPQSLLRCHRFYMHSCVCVCACARRLVSLVIKIRKCLPLWEYIGYRGARGTKGVSGNVLYLVWVQIIWVYMSKLTALNIQVHTFYCINVKSHF